MSTDISIIIAIYKDKNRNQTFSTMYKDHMQSCSRGAPLPECEVVNSLVKLTKEYLNRVIRT